MDADESKIVKLLVGPENAQFYGGLDIFSYKRMLEAISILIEITSRKQTLVLLEKIVYGDYQSLADIKHVVDSLLSITSKEETVEILSIAADLGDLVYNKLPWTIDEMKIVIPSGKIPELLKRIMKIAERDSLYALSDTEEIGRQKRGGL